MKYEFEIPDEDLRDREILVTAVAKFVNDLDGLSDFGKNTLGGSLETLVGYAEWCENQWILAQRQRATNKLSEVLNIDRAKLEDLDDF